MACLILQFPGTIGIGHLTVQPFGATALQDSTRVQKSSWHWGNAQMEIQDATMIIIPIGSSATLSAISSLFLATSECIFDHSAYPSDLPQMPLYRILCTCL